MGQGFMIGSECADWWEARNKEYHDELEQYVLDNPGYFAVFVATGKATAADFAVTMWVDLARLGEGAAEGSVSGIFQDVFRVLNFIPEGKVLQGSKTLLGRAVQMVSNLAIWRRLNGGLCVPIAIAQVIQRGGHGLGVGLAAIAKALETPLIGIFKSGTDWRVVERALSKLGLQFAKFSFSGTAFKTFDDLIKLAARQSGPLLVRIVNAAEEGHAILIDRTLGGIKIIDRYGIFSSLDDLARHYNMGAWKFAGDDVFAIANAVVDPSLLKHVAQMDVLACLVRQSVAVFDINFSKISKEALVADFDKFLERKGKKKVLQGPETAIVGGFTVEVVAGRPDKATLSGIAKAQYGDFNLWPLIFDLNKAKIGTNPNRLAPGMKLLLLPLARYSGAELADARKRAPNWMNHR
jgi:hypothetical protein